MNMLSTLTREDDVRCSPDDFAVAKENLDTPGASSSELPGKPNHIARIVEWYAGNNNLPTHET